MLDFLHKQAEEHVKTREMLIQMNEELEKEMNQNDKVIFKVKRDLEFEKKNCETHYRGEGLIHFAR